MTEPLPGLPLTSSAIAPLQLGLTQLDPTPVSNTAQLNVDAAASAHGTNEDSIRALRDQVTAVTQGLQAQTQAVALLRAAQAPTPIAPQHPASG